MTFYSLTKMTICLSMIIKNEQDCIERCLLSVLPIIDSWVINDNGSTDNSQNIINKTLKNLPGKIINSPFINFSHNRNLALEEAKLLGDYILIIDADDILVINSPLPILNHDIYNLKIKYGNIEYERPQLIKSSIKSSWKCPVHEYLDCDGSRALLDNCFIKITNDGERSKDKNKFIKDAELLENELKNDPNNPRYLYYLAQSYRDAGNINKSIEIFEKRIKINGWNEEDYMACINLSKLYILKNNKRFEEILLKAFNKIKRVEAMYYLSLYYRLQEEYDKAYFYASVGINCQKPISGLFIEHEIYKWKMMDEMAISAYYIGKKQECKELNLLLLNVIPEIHRNRILNNISFC